MPKYLKSPSPMSSLSPAIVAGISIAAFVLPATAQQTSQYTEQGQLIRAPQALGVLGEDLFGDSTNFYTGSLEFIQTDVSVPGNSALPVGMGRRMKSGAALESSGHFGNWDMEIPYLHGIFATGWNTGLGTDSTRRCSKFGAPMDAQSNYTNNAAVFKATEFWHGNYIYVPGKGDQEMLRRSAGNTQAPDGLSANYPVLTRDNWQFSCLTQGAAEFFVARAPVGTTYRFDWEVSRAASRRSKTNAGPDRAAFAMGGQGVDGNQQGKSTTPTPTPAQAWRRR
ncbi:hypothetical protein [Massilia sp. TWR1-2-2]|uniref:hypothetical protein n=1 Tax=Massilia sp. TWR1-2-2 TaxID=2804584 RepID=UPI003CE8DD23